MTEQRSDPQGSAQLARLFVLGPLGLFSNGDRNLTPRGKKTQGLLALLAMSPRGQRTRVWLRDKLWSSSDEKKSSSSLRQTVFELRKDLGDLADRILLIDRTSIGLRLDRVWIDMRALAEDPAQFGPLGLSEETELLEGIDIADEEFEDWLQIERQIWFDKAVELSAAVETPAVVAQPALHPVPASPIAAPSPTFSIGFLPNIQHGCDANTQFLADYVQEGVARNLREFEPVTVYDFRDATAHSDQLMAACETEYYTRARTLQVGDGITLTFLLYRSSRMSLEWSQSIQTTVREIMDTAFLLEGFIAQNVDRLAHSLYRETRNDEGEAPPAPQAGFAALNMMFKLDPKALANSQALLDQSDPAVQGSIFPALRAYLASFKLGENLGELDMAELRDVRNLTQGAMDETPFNSVSLACLGHVMGYVFRDHDAAKDLLERAVTLNPSQAFAWDHYALHKIYTGDFGAAYDAARKAASLGSFSPIGFSYDTTLSMAATMAGDHDRAIAAGRNALRKQPRFAAAMRYLIVNYVLSNRHREAEEMYLRLLEVDPDFRDPEIQKERFRFSKTSSEKLVLKAIKDITT